MPEKIICFVTEITDEIIKKLASGSEKPTTWNTLMKLAEGKDMYGEPFKILPANIAQVKRNWDGGIGPRHLAINFDHKRGKAAGWIQDVKDEKSRLRTLNEWTPSGAKAIADKEYRFLSAEYSEDYLDKKTGQRHGWVLLGAGLTNVPAIIDQEPLMLSDGSKQEVERRIVFHPDLAKQLSEKNSEEEMNVKKFLATLLIASGLPAESRKSLGTELEKKLTDKSTEDEVIKLASEAIDAERKKLSDAAAAADAKKLADDKDADAKKLAADKQPPADDRKTLSQADVEEMFTKRLAAEKEKERKLAEARTARIDAFEKRLSAAAGLPDETKKSLSADYAEFVTGDMHEAMANRYADRMLAMAEPIIAQAKLAAEGYQFDGRVIVTDAPEQKRALAVCDFLDEKVLKLAKDRKVAPRNKALAEAALADFDRRHLSRLHDEGKRFLAGGPTGMANTTIGTSLFSVGRTLLREALYDLVATNFVAASVEGLAVQSPTIYIPYVSRERESDLLSALIKYQGQAIGRAQMVQSGESGYVSPLKLATALYNEVLLFGPRAGINYNPLAENLGACSRIIGEAIDELLLTEIVQACDEYGATAVVGEVLTAQCAGANSTFQLGLVGAVLTKFPLIKPRKNYDLTGVQVGSTVNPITVTYDGVARTEYDGTGTQDAGIYWKITDWALGQFQLVNQLGVVQVPAAAKVLIVSYSYSTNRSTFDFYDATGALKWDEHMDVLLRTFKRAKTAMKQDRFTAPNYILTSSTLHEYCSEAKSFKPTDITPDLTMGVEGNAARIAATPTFETQSPVTILGSKRGILGARDTTKYVITDPWAFKTELQEMKDSNGKFIGGKDTYGEQFHCIHTPGGPSGALKGQCTQVIAYDSRTAANGGDVGPF